MYKVALVSIVLVILASLLTAQEVKLPVFFLRYAGGFDHEENEEDANLEPDSIKHSVRLRVKEEWSSRLTSNLTVYYSTKEYIDTTLNDDYWYVYLKPEVSFDATDRLRLDGGFRSKWAEFEGPDTEGLSKDYISLSGNVVAPSRPEPARGSPLRSRVRGTSMRQTPSRPNLFRQASDFRVGGTRSPWEATTKAVCPVRWGEAATKNSGCPTSLVSI